MTEVQPAVPADDIPPGSQRMNRTTRNVIEWAVIVLVALLAAFLIKTFLFQPFYIPSSSMEDTLEIDDRILINKLSYKLHAVHRGDIVVFERPEGRVSEQIKDLVKRVIAVGGDTVEGRADGIYVNGKRLREPYLKEPYSKKGSVHREFEPQTLKEHEVFVMGDNRNESHDSRDFGPIDEDLIEGRAFVRFWPLSALGLL